MLDNTITFRAILTHRLTGYEPGAALLDLRISFQPVQAILSIPGYLATTSNPPALYTQTLS